MLPLMPRWMTSVSPLSRAAMMYFARRHRRITRCPVSRLAKSFGNGMRRSLRLVSTRVRRWPSKASFSPVITVSTSGSSGIARLDGQAVERDLQSRAHRRAGGRPHAAHGCVGKRRDAQQRPCRAVVRDLELQRPAAQHRARLERSAAHLGPDGPIRTPERQNAPAPRALLPALDAEFHPLRLVSADHQPGLIVERLERTRDTKGRGERALPLEAQETAVVVGKAVMGLAPEIGPGAGGVSQ